MAAVGDAFAGVCPLVEHDVVRCPIAEREPNPVALCSRRIERVVLNDGRPEREPSADQLVVEAPLELRIAGQPLMVIMRTPGEDRELATGLLLAEGVIDTAADLAGMREPASLQREERGNVLELGLPVSAYRPNRATVATSSCGVCGKTAIAELELRAPAVYSDLQISAATVASLPGRLRAAQVTFDATGGLHAAGAFDGDGRLLAIREDVGRHNATDKLIGWALNAGRIPMTEFALCVSGRVSFEIVQKAVVAGIPVVVAVSAPSSLAVDLAERFRVTLCGFTRDGRFNVYSHGVRVCE
jgi:FdhD protein